MESDIHETNIIERVIPTENVQLMFHYKNPFLTCYPDNKTIQQPRSIINGLSNSYADVSTLGEAGVIFVIFYSTGACNFFDFPLLEIENQSIDLSDIFSREIKQVEELLYLKKTIKERVFVVEDFLLNRYSPIPFYDNLIIKNGVNYIKHYKGQITAVSLSNKLSTTTKSLERKFSQYLGKTPKQFIKLIRFQEILSGLSIIKNINLTEYTYRNGYFDQSHFIRDFKTYTGCTPKEFVLRYPGCDINADFSDL